jgi:hypothetical protein
MADSSTLAAGLDSLTEAGVGRVALLRLFVSGTSFLERTDRLLGLTAVPRERPAGIAHDLHIVSHTNGLAASTQVPTILRDRAMELSIDPPHESILVLAHGLRGEPENADLLRLMESAAQPLRDVGFRKVRVATLREDWADRRQEAEADVRLFVSERRNQGDRVLVLPYRLSGFGPYASVLDGLSHEAGRGFLPHPQVTEWMRETVDALIAAHGWH